MAINNCFENILGLKSLCLNEEKQPLLYFDNEVGINQSALAKLASSDDVTGKNLFERLKNSAIRSFQSDIETILPTNYTFLNELTNICSACKFTGLFLSARQKAGIVVKNTTHSNNTELTLKSFQISIGTTGTFTVVLDDGETMRSFSHGFVQDEVINILNVNFKTQKKVLKIYILESVKPSKIACAKSSCGCGGSSKKEKTDLFINGFENGEETTQQYNFIPCVSVNCISNLIVCNLVSSAPNLVGSCILYKTAHNFFSENVLTQRINLQALDKEKKKDYEQYYADLYNISLRGNAKKNIGGIADIIQTNLSKYKNDGCIDCKSVWSTSYAKG